MRYMGGSAEDLKRDMAELARDPETQRWWKVSGPECRGGVPQAESLIYAGHRPNAVLFCSGSGLIG